MVPTRGKSFGHFAIAGRAPSVDVLGAKHCDPEAAPPAGCGQAMPVPQIPCPLPLPDADSCPTGADTKRNPIETTPGVARDLQIFEYLLSFR